MIANDSQSATHQPTTRQRHCCPWWLGPLMASPLRRLLDDPVPWLRGLIRPGMTVLDFGCAMGFHSLPAARLVGDGGRVLSVDVQPRMIAGLRRRAARAGLSGRIEARTCGEGDVGLNGESGTVDLVLAIHVIHETPDPRRCLAQLRAALRPGGRLVLAEPSGHVSARAFEETLHEASLAGLHLVRPLSLRRSRAVLLERPVPDSAM